MEKPSLDILPSKGKQKSLFGFTLVELLTVIGILILLTAVSVPVFRTFQKESDLINTVESIINVLRYARNKTLASEESSQWGVWLSTSTTPQEYILFKGENYTLRDSSYDKVHKISQKVEIYAINLAGGKSEVVFNRILGTTDYYGNISLRLKVMFQRLNKLLLNNLAR